MNFTMNKIAAAAVLAFAATGAQAAPVAIIAPSNFYMTVGAGLDTAGVVPSGSFVGSDTALAGFVDTAAGTWGVSSTTTFFGGLWTASGGQLITTAGNYSMNTATGVVTAGGTPMVANDGTMWFTVGAGQVAGTIDFAWSTSSNIRVINVWNVSMVGGNSVYTAALVPGMENGPFPGYNASFNMAPPLDDMPPPIPEASTYTMMLAGLGLVGFVARRRKQAEA